MRALPQAIRFELPGWSLFWAALESLPENLTSLTDLRAETARWVREQRELADLAKDDVVAGMRKLFRQAGTDPTRYRPSSEALLRRILKGGEIPEIHPFVDFSNCLSARLAAPCCVMAEGTFEPPFLMRSGKPGEAYDSLRGPFQLEGRPILVDSIGPCDTPITGNKRVKVLPETRRCTLVAYLPAEILGADICSEVFSELADKVQLTDFQLFFSP